MGSLRGGGDPSELLYGTLEHGYYGEVPTSEFIDGVTLASEIGLIEGVSINSDAGWLKFALDYKTLYVAKRAFRYNLSWDQINACGAVFGTAQVEINGKLYRVRLLKGRGDGLTNTISAGFDTQPTHNSEWNRLMYHVSGTPFGNASNTLASEGISVGDWAQFSEDELLTSSSFGNGSRSVCQDKAGVSYISRGYAGVSRIMVALPTSYSADFGWRPCLELVL